MAEYLIGQQTSTTTISGKVLHQGCTLPKSRSNQWTQLHDLMVLGNNIPLSIHCVCVNSLAFLIAHLHLDCLLISSAIQWSSALQVALYREKVRTAGQNIMWYILYGNQICGMYTKNFKHMPTLCFVYLN